MTTREDILSLVVDAMEDAASGMRYVRENYGDLSGVGFDRVQEKYLNVISKLRAAPTPPAAEAHPDDLAVDRFAAIMKAKLAVARDKGRGGWEDREQCPDGYLSQLLREHVEKGDPVDVANLAMMLSLRGERITPADEAPGQEPVALTVDDVEQIIVSTESTESDAVWTRRMAKALHARLVSAPPTYADAEAKGVEPTDKELRKEVAKAISIAAWGSDRFWNTLLAEADAAILAIRSLASPSPKGET